MPGNSSRTLARTAATAITALAMCLPASAEKKAFQLRDNRFYIDIQLNGRPVLALLDTGSFTSAIDQAVAHELGLDKGNTGNVQGVGAAGRIVDSETTPPAEIRLDAGIATKQRLAIRDLAKSAKEDDFPVDIHVGAIVGLDALSDLVADIDFDRQRIEFLSAKTHRATPPGQPFSLKRAHGLYILRSKVGGKDADLVFDTGANSALHMSILWERSAGVLEGLRASSMVVSGADGSYRMPVTTLPQANVGNVDFAAVPLTMTPRPLPRGIDGVLGVDVLRRFHVTIDFSGARVWLQPDAAIGSAFRRDRIGVHTFGAPGARTIIDVAPGSPAQRAGFKVGEVFLDIYDDAGAVIETWASAAEDQPLTIVMADQTRRNLVAKAYY